MKIKNVFAAITVLSVIASTDIMEAKDIKLPTPAFTGGMAMNEVVAKRRSTREFDATREVEKDKLGQILWTAVGVNRPDAEPGKFGVPANRSNPTALNRQEIHAYVFLKEGVYEYEPASHTLKQVTEGDHRSLISGTAAFRQNYVMDAPCSILFVADLTNLPEDEGTRSMALIDAGIACENLNLACASLGLGTVPRASMDTEGISALLGFTKLQIPVINNPVGYPK